MQIDRLEQLLKDESILDIKTLVAVVCAYRKIEKTNGEHLSRVAEAMKLDKDTLLRKIKAFEKYFGLCVFPRTAGRNTTVVNKDPIVQQLIQDVERGVTNYPGNKSCVSGVPPINLRVGASLTLLPSFCPAATAGLRSRLLEEHARNNDESAARSVFVGPESFVVEFQYDDPHVLRRRGVLDGAFDIVVSSYHDDSEFPELRSQTPFRQTLPMGLVVHRNHPLAENVDEITSWHTIKERAPNITIVLQGLNRLPQPTYPYDRFQEAAAQTVRVDSYTEATAIVLAGGNAACIIVPELLTPDHRSRLCALKSLPDLPKVEVAVIRPKAAQERNTAQHNRLADELRKTFETELRQISAPNDLQKHLGDDLRTAYSVGRKGNNIEWIRGRLRNMDFTHDRCLYADHLVMPPGQDPIHFSVNGHFSTGTNKDLSSGETVYHIVWHGRKMSGPTADEEYAVSIFALESNLRCGPLVGQWLGRCSWRGGRSYEPDTGYFVIVSDEVATRSQPAQWKYLRKAIEDHLFRSEIEKRGPSIPNSPNES